MVSNSQRRYIGIAIEEAKKSTILQRHGCVIVSSGKVIGRGYNSERNYSKDKIISNCASCHAEISAIRSVAKRTRYISLINLLKKAVIYIVRLSPNGDVRSSGPCEHCLDLIKITGIKKIIFLNDNHLLKITKPGEYKKKHNSTGYIWYLSLL